VTLCSEGSAQEMRPRTSFQSDQRADQVAV
jgi:hypothetical protein